MDFVTRGERKDSWMKIDSSNVSMASSRKSFEYAATKTVVSVGRSDSAIKLDLTPGAKSAYEQVEEFEKQKEQALKEQEKNQKKQSMISMRDQMLKQKERANENEGAFAKTFDDMQVSLLKMLLDALNKRYHKENPTKEYSISNDLNLPKNNQFSLTSNDVTGANGNAPKAQLNISGNLMFTSMKRTTVVSSFELQSENTAFEARGMVHTKDGRSIDFGITLELSQSFCREFESVSQESFILCDPLVVNFDTPSATLSDQKFLFDLDSDGKKEEVSFTGKGSGFLAYDKNDDGVINDGSELFGTKSGDGFSDLAKYDKDGNGWIDESDEIFNKLKIWTKDENGKDRLISLKDADVGAIFLGNASTDFSLRNSQTYDMNGQIRKTGVFLKESGGAGTIQHVDLAI